MTKRISRSILAILASGALSSGLWTQTLWAQTNPSPLPLKVRMDILDVSRFEPPAGDAQRVQTVDGHGLKIATSKYRVGICTYADAEIVIGLNAKSFHFTGLFGVDDETNPDGAIDCKLLLDGKPVADSGVLKWGDAAKQLDADLTGANELTIRISNTGGGHAHVDIVNGVITYTPGAPRPDIERKFADPDATKIPPLASGNPDAPEIHGPRTTGTTPGRPFIFLIPATGKGTLTYAADNLPDGLSLDPQTGIISGAVKSAGNYAVTLTVTSDLGKATRTLTIVAGEHKLAQTPPMGWNSWNAWGDAVDAKKIRQSADAMVSSGLAAKGFQYINIDDYWEGGRAADGTIQSSAKFGDVKALADYVHSKGLRLGIYSSPGPKTCGKNEGSYQHELEDAQWFAKNGVDYLKYDWCSYGSVVGKEGRTIPKIVKPYRVMGEALNQVDRDIVYSLCQYGMGNVWQWGAQVNGNLWRTTNDIIDSWTSMANIGFNQAGISRYAAVGHWNDPDMLVVGKVSWGAELHPSRLTPSEQLTHITLWSMLSAPLLMGCDMTQLDPFTIDLMTNSEVLDIDQDPLGRGGEPARIDGQIEIWKKSLFDGTTAVAVFNRGRMPSDVTVRWSDIGLSGSQKVRDLWQQKDLGEIPAQIQVRVPRHGAVLLKVGAPSEPHF